MALFRCSRCHAAYEDHYPPDDTRIKCNKGHIRITTIRGGTTMTAIKPTIKLFTTQVEDSTGIHINSLILEHNGNNYQFHAGAGDSVHVFIESIALYVLTINKSNGTMGLNAFMSPEPDPINCIFLHTPREVRETLGAKWEQLSPKALTMKLINYLY